MAEVDRLSTSVSIRHTYFPPWLSWMLRIIRSPETLYKWRQPSKCIFRQVIVLLWLLVPRYESHITLCRHITLCTITSSPGHWFSHFFRGQQQTRLWTNKSTGCPSGSTSSSSPTSHPTQTATSFTQDTKGKHSLVNWQDNPNYSLITQAQTRERMSKIPSRKSKYYYKEELWWPWISTVNANNRSQ